LRRVVPPVAQSTVTVTGTVDAYAGRIAHAGDPAATKVLNGWWPVDSWFGFIASEDLGDGLRAP